MKNILAACSFLLVSYMASAQKDADTSFISPNFSNFSGTLLFEECSRPAITKILEKRLKKFYKGEFEMIQEDDEKQRSYSNLKKYPFVIKFVGSTHGTNSPTNTDYYCFVMTDRVTGKEYKSPYGADNTIPIYSNMISYLKELEKRRAQ